MKRLIFLGVVAVACSGTTLAAATPEAKTGALKRYVVLYEASASPAAAKAAIKEAGGRLLRANTQVGVATVVSANPDFLSKAASSIAIEGVARDRVIGAARTREPKFSVELMRDLREATKARTRDSEGDKGPRGGNGEEPLAPLQWDMKMIHATADGSYSKERGDKDVLVGIIDTGVDGKHPDIAPNFSQSLSRNFTTDIPLIDGPCADEPDQSCSDAADVDENSHGTHVASTIGSPINNLGMAGVAPKVTLVNLRAGQDSGYFFLQPSVDALTYAGDHGIDVVNMSYFIDPWLFNCRSNPADSPAEQAEQRTIIEATQRALDYAHLHGVTLIAAAGNEHTNLAQVTSDEISPDFPPGTERSRIVDNNCLILPEQGNNVIGVSAVGPSKAKADYSNYGYDKITVAAPGGYFRDAPWSPSMTPEQQLAAGVPNLILAAYPTNVAEELGDLNPDGTPNTPFVVRDCRGSTCAYYQWIQGTSMATPHAVGVAALIVSKFGKRSHHGISLNPFLTQAILQGSATDTPCPAQNPFSYADKGRPASYTAFCEGTPIYNGFYGHGIVDALTAVSGDVLDD
jgi:lantibiotic leader peptide-processing serine protease